MFAALELDFVLVCSKYLRRFLSDNYGIPEEKLFVLYQGIQLENIPFRIRSIDPSRRIKILFVKHRHRKGGLAILAKALGRLNMFAFDLTVLGPPIESEKEIKAWFNKTPHVKLNLRGPVTQETVHQELAFHDILCIPSIFEAQGLANVEGLAHGISVVSTTSGGIPEVLDFGNAGWLCEPENSESLAQGLKQCILANLEQRRLKSQYGRTIVETQFNYRVMLSSLIDIVEKRCQQKK
jgi:glycosyltransferase involved in cell wall biosynthesis